MGRLAIYSEEEKRERKKIHNKKYQDKNKKKLKNKYKEQKKKYYQTPAGKKISVIARWKKRGLFCEDYDMLYENYLSETHCDLCRIKFGEKGDGSGTFKCLDHDHATGEFRNFLCNKCNVIRG